MVKIYKNYINGSWVSSGSKKTFNSINPATKKIIAKFQASNHFDVDDAVIAAQKAFDLWSETPAPQRAEILLKVSTILKKRKKELGKLVATEMGKVISEAEGDVQEAIDIFEYMAGEGRRLFGITTPSELKNKFCLTTRIPIGVVALITPWNFPIAIPAWKISTALICGNTIVFKPSSDTPLCAIKLVEILIQAGLPKGVINLVTGSGGEVGNPLIKHPDVHGISFTGSRETGDYITRNVGLKKIGLELGGKNPIIVMEDANLDLAVDGVLWGAFGTTGQRCTACSRVIVHKKVKNSFTKKLIAKTKKLRLGPGYVKTSDVGPLINQAALDKVYKYIEIGKKEAKLVYGGKKVNKKGFFVQPTIFTNVKYDSRIAQEEIFGPVISIIECSNINEAIKIANSVTYGLSSSVYTSNISNSFKSINKIQAGLTYINSSTIGSEVHLPFGGVKDTGHTREAGVSGIDEFSNIKTVYFDYNNKLQKAQGVK